MLKSHDFRNQMANEMLQKYDIPILKVRELTQGAQEMHVQSDSKTGIVIALTFAIHNGACFEHIIGFCKLGLLKTPEKFACRICRHVSAILK